MVTNPKGQVILSILILFAIILFNSFFYIFRPYDGMGIYQEDPLGEVYEVVPGGPAERAGIRVGDRILAIDGKLLDPLRSEPRYRPWIKAGDTIHYSVQRANEQLDLPLVVGSYLDDPTLLATYLGIQFLSFGLWGIGLVLVLFVPVDDVRARLLGLGFLLAGLTAAVGSASGWNSFWGANTLQKVLLVLLAPLLVAAHLTFPQLSFVKVRKALINIAFVIAGLFSILVIVDDWVLTPRGISLAAAYGVHLRQWVLGVFMISWLAAVALLLNNRFRSLDAEMRRQTGIIIWGMGLGIGPFFVLTLLPYLLFGEEYLTGAFSILFLILLPLAYAYVIFQRKLLKVDFIINRIVVWFTLILLILGTSILVFGIFVALFNLPSGLPIYAGLGATLIALPFTSLSKSVQERVDRVLYGSHYDYLTVTSSLSKQLAQTLDRDRLVELLTVQLPQQMGIRQTALLLSNGNDLEPAGITGNKPTFLLDDNLYQDLLKSRSPIRSSHLWPLLPPAATSPWDEYRWGQVFAPLIFKDDLQGILILGRRLSGDVYSDQDMKIIATVAEQGALAISNVLLFEKQHRLAQQLVRSSEEERRRIASELHDSVLQDLFFIKQVVHQNPENPELVQYLEGCIQNLRVTIKAQRTPLLDQGLPLALQGLVEDMQKIAGKGTQVAWKANINGSAGLNDEQATAVFRIAQEALTNAVKHAHARHIEVWFERAEDQSIRLRVRDDGIGASWLYQDGNLNQNHFGLVLMQERAEMINGRLHFITVPGEGTTIELEVNP